jgi:hypothetical protein
MADSYEQQLVKWAKVRYGRALAQDLRAAAPIGKVTLNVNMETDGCDTCGYGERQWVDVVIWDDKGGFLSSYEFNFDGANNSFSSLLQEIIEA